MRKKLGIRVGRSIVLTVALALAFWLVAPPGSAGAVSALMMGGTSQPHPDRVNGYMDTTSRRYLDPASICKLDDCTLVPVYIPNEASPIWTDGMAFGPSVEVGTGLLEDAVRTALYESTEDIVIFGNSQSATVATEVKRLLGADSTIDKSRLSFVLIGNPTRPNGGFMQRWFPAKVPVLEYLPDGTPVSGAGMPTTDIAFQYDIAADFPRYPGNLLAVLNVFVGMAVHGAYDDKVNPNGYTEEQLLAEINNLKNRTTVGDTTYVTIPTKVLPLAQALRGVGYTHGLSAILNPVADFLEPVLRVLVELGYDRTISPGAQRGFGMFPKVNPLKVATDIGAALGQGFRNMVTNLGAQQQGSGDAAGATGPGPSPQPDVTPQSRHGRQDTGSTVANDVERFDDDSPGHDLPEGDGDDDNPAARLGAGSSDDDGDEGAPNVLSDNRSVEVTQDDDDTDADAGADTGAGADADAGADAEPADSEPADSEPAQE